MRVLSLVEAGSVAMMSQSSVGMVCIQTLLDTSNRLELNFLPSILRAATQFNNKINNQNKQSKQTDS
jgi:3,4-dihydroxy-2-butanone 4-phosphate synthase